MSQPHHILLRRRTDAITDKDLAFLERALEIQLRECAREYGLVPPGVTLVTPDTHLPTDDAVAIDFVDNDGVPGAVAHHGWSERANFAWALVGVQEAFSWTVAASHEALEYLVNLKLDRFVEGPRGLRWPIEICDPVEADSYEVNVSIFGERRAVRVSDWVMPEFWDAGSTSGPWDKMSHLSGPFSLSTGGYALVTREGEPLELGGGSRHGDGIATRAGSRVERLRGFSPAPTILPSSERQA